MFTVEKRSSWAGRIAAAAIFSLSMVGCGSVQAPPEEPTAAPMATPVATAGVVPPLGQAPIEELKALLADPRAKPAMLGAGGLLAVVLLGVGLRKVLRGDKTVAPSANDGSVRGV